MPVARNRVLLFITMWIAHLRRNSIRVYGFRSMAWFPTNRQPTAFHAPRITRWMTQSIEDDDTDTPISSMENLYQAWSLEQDQNLWRNKDKPLPELASLLGRGIRGVEARLSKLQDVSSPAYERLFAGSESGALEDSNSKTKLIPVGEVLRRIEWDYTLDASDFFILHYDRMDDTIVESPVDAPNSSIAGKETSLAKALPEHRIVGVKYKERVVWDRPHRIDLVFGEPGIYHVMETYDEWKAERDQVQEWNRQRQKQVADRIRRILGFESYQLLQQLSSDVMQQHEDPTVSSKTKVEEYVANALNLFRQVRADPTKSLDPTWIPMSDYLALDEFSELVSLLPQVDLRGMILLEISRGMAKAEGKSKQKIAMEKVNVVLLEEDLTETFVRGSGPGGQKINKTSNRVLLVHEPTQLKVECQETRSLSQNRKIARQRLKDKLDQHWNGAQSKASWKQQKASTKRQKSKSKNRARQRKKQLEKEQLKLQQQQQQQQQDQEELEENW